jgi:hypothetical protein
MAKITDKQVQSALAIIKGYEAQKKSQPKNDGLTWWTNKGFKVTQKGLSLTASNGKKYPAIKGVTKDGQELTLLATRGGAVYTKAF